MALIHIKTMQDQSFLSPNASTTTIAQDTPPLATRLCRFGLAILFLLFLMYVVSPFLVKNFSPLGEYARVVNETGIIPGALYYSDVPQTVDAEFNNRDAIRF